MAHATRAATERQDLAEHQKTFDGFVRLATIGTIWVLTHVVALAIGGVAGHWFTAGFWLVISTIAAVLGLVVRGLDWKPVTVVLALMLATLLTLTH
jgi:hypothetical protein